MPRSRWSTACPLRWRNSPYANSGLVTEVRLDDFVHLRDEWGELAGLRFQQMFEETARLHGGAAQVAPAQRVADFVAGRPSRTLPATSYIPGITPSRLDGWMPRFIAESLRAGLRTFGRRMRGFVTGEAVVVGVESRTSTPCACRAIRPRGCTPKCGDCSPRAKGQVMRAESFRRRWTANRMADAVADYVEHATMR